MSRKAATILGVGTSLALIWFLLGGKYSYSSVCHHCGATKSGTRWFVPGIEVSYYHPNSVRPTPVSKVLDSSKIVGPHEHDWWLSQGNGSGILGICAIGQGRHLRRSVESEDVAAIISAAHRFGDIDFREKVVKALLDPKTSQSVFHLGDRVEADSFTTAESFRDWATEHAPLFFEELVMAKTE